MKNLQFVKKAEGGKIIIDVPEELEGKELAVSISEAEALEESTERWHLLPPEKKLQILQRYQGTAKYPDVPINKYDVYEQ